MKGFSLIELLVVIAITSILSLFAYESIGNFQSQSQVEAASQELVSTLRSAQSKSRSGMIELGGTYTPDGLPIYSVIVNGFVYTVRRTDTPLSTGVVENVDEETHQINSTLTVTPSSATVSFARVTGLPISAQIFTLKKGTSTTTKTITIAANGLITVQ